MDEAHEGCGGLLAAQSDAAEASGRVEEAFDPMALFAESTIDGRLAVRLGVALIWTIAPR